jgi:hypothetical protein
MEMVRALSRTPRPAGGEAETAAREYCAQRLRAAGFDVHEEPFEYSSFVGRWGTPIAGVVALAILLTASSLARRENGSLALELLALGAVVLSVVGAAMARRGVLAFPAGRCRGVNLIATRGTSDPTLWLMAHLDSKSQPVPILVRAAGITLVGIVWMVAMVLVTVQVLTGRDGGAGWGVLNVFAIIGAIPVIATTVGSRSAGALDNATGVATVLAAAEDAAATDVAICLTSGEELGLAGARAWARTQGRGAAVAVNCDTVDDRGATTCMYNGLRPDVLVASVIAAGARAGSQGRAHRLLPGVLTDGVALRDAGWPVVTLSKGGVRTLARIHTSRDRADDLTGSGMDELARLLVELIETRN